MNMCSLAMPEFSTGAQDLALQLDALVLTAVGLLIQGGLPSQRVRGSTRPGMARIPLDPLFLVWGLAVGAAVWVLPKEPPHSKSPRGSATPDVVGIRDGHITSRGSR